MIKNYSYYFKPRSLDMKMVNYNNKNYIGF